MSLNDFQFGLSPIQIGAIFLAGPGTYILFTPINGCLADKKVSGRNSHLHFLLESSLLRAIGLEIKSVCINFTFV